MTYITKNKPLPSTTKSQTKIINYQYKFRYLTINQFQQLLHHKDSRRIREWLHDLVSNKYLNIIKPKIRTKPWVFCLAQRAGHILKKEEDIDGNFLNWLYKEKNYGETFRNHQLFIVDTYLYFLRNKEKGTEINFFTKQDLYGYGYFPDPLPDAYIDVEEKDGSTRYFLEYFDSSIPSGSVRYRVGYYIKYADNGSWKENTNNEPIPSVLFIGSTENRKKHINYYGKALLEKSFNDEIQIFVTTESNIKYAKDGVNIWQKVE